MFLHETTHLLTIRMQDKNVSRRRKTTLFTDYDMRTVLQDQELHFVVTTTPNMQVNSSDKMAT